MPKAWGQAGYVGMPLPTDPSIDGTLVLSTSRNQAYYAQVYQTDKPEHAMVGSESSFSTLTNLGTILGDEVGEPRYAGDVPMTTADIQALYKDMHAFEKVLKAIAAGRIYHYVIICQSYGPTYGQEVDGDRYSDASGPLHFYERLSTMDDDKWNFWHITDNAENPMTGSQSYTINTWWKASSKEWYWQGVRDYSQTENFKGWHLRREAPMPPYIPTPSAPPPIIQAVAIAPTPIVMGEIVGEPYAVAQTDEDRPCSSILSCCPKA